MLVNMGCCLICALCLLMGLTEVNGLEVQLLLTEEGGFTPASHSDSLRHRELTGRFPLHAGFGSCVTDYFQELLFYEISVLFVDNHLLRLFALLASE